jgi:hypothetical protein
MRRKLTIILPCLLLALLIAGHTAAWFAGTSYLETAFHAWEAQRRAAGWQVESGTPVRGGWPLAASLTVPDLALSAGPQGAPGRVAWHGERVVLSVSITSPDRLGVDLIGSQTLRVAPGPELPFSADLLHFEAPLSRALSAPVVGLEVRGLHAQGVSIGLLTGQATAAGSPALTLAAEAIDLPPSEAWAFGPHISSLALDATLRGPLPPPGPIPAMAAGWRDTDGAVDITHLALGWGPLGLSATAHLALDAQLQPIGTTELHVIGFAKAASALAAQHIISKDQAGAATAVMTLLARVPPDGGAPQVDVPLTLRDRVLSMGKTPLLRLPEVVWPH